MGSEGCRCTVVIVQGLKGRRSADDTALTKVLSAKVLQLATWCLLQQPPQGKELIEISLLVLLSLHKPTPTHWTHTEAPFN